MVKPEFIKHKDKPILYLNFSYMDKNDIVPYMDEAKLLLEGKDQKSVLFLANVEKMGFDHTIVWNFIEFLKVTKEYSKATAVLGMDPVRKHLYQAALDISGRGQKQVQFFNTAEEARDWLTAI